MRLILPILAALTLLAGCGGGGGDLSRDDKFDVLMFSSVATTACSEFGQDLGYAPGEAPPDLAVPALAALRSSPDAVPSDDGTTVRELMSAAARDLRPCYPDVADRIDDALR